MKKWEPLHLTHNNSKSEEGQGNHLDEIKKMFKTRRVPVIKCKFCTEGSSEDSRISEMS